MDSDVIITKGKNPILVKYNEIFDKSSSELLISSLLFKKDFEWNTYTIQNNFTNYAPPKQDNIDESESEKSNSSGKSDEHDSEWSLSNSRSSNLLDEHNKLDERDKSGHNKPNTKMPESYETNYEIISFSDTVWYNKKYYGCAIETHLLKKHKEIFGLIENKIHNVIEDINEKNWATNLKYPNYWLAFHYRDGNDCLNSLSNVIRFYNRSDNDPVVMICLGEDRDLDCGEDVTMNNGSVFIIFNPFKDYNAYIAKNKDCRKQHVSLLGFYCGFV